MQRLSHSYLITWRELTLRDHLFALEDATYLRATYGVDDVTVNTKKRTDPIIGIHAALPSSIFR